MIVAKSPGLTNFAVINIILIVFVPPRTSPSSFTTFNRLKENSLG
jgi:hypothetical protein